MTRQFIFALLFCVAAPLMAQAAEDIVIVNMEAVLKESVAIQKIQEQVKSKRKAFQEKVQAKEDELRESKRELLEQRSLLAKEAYEGKIKDFQEQANSISRELQEQRAAYDKASGAAINEVKAAIADIVNKLAVEKGFKLALPSGVVLYYGEALDITKEVASRLNKKLPKVKTKLP